jgi:hypothetical protein
MPMTGPRPDERREGAPTSRRWVNRPRSGSGRPS